MNPKRSQHSRRDDLPQPPVWIAFICPTDRDEFRNGRAYCITARAWMTVRLRGKTV